MTRTHHKTICFLCEASCGLRVEHDGERVYSVRGDAEDPLSRGYLCPKAAAIPDVQQDPDRVVHPLIRDRATGHRRRASHEEALDLVATQIARIQRTHGNDALGFYRGNPANHNYATTLLSTTFYGALGTRNRFSSRSLDSLPRLLTSVLVYGSQATLPVPDLDRTDHLLLIGANPLVSNGSIMTAPDVAARLRAITERGRVVVIDPRRTRTARAATESHFIRPGTDVFFLLALLSVIYDEGLARPTPRVAAMTTGLETIPGLVRPFTPERVADRVAIEAQTLRRIAREFATAERAVCYGRLGTCTQEYGTTTSWLIDVLNLVTGNLDEPGGAMFTRPAVDLGDVAARLGRSGTFARYHSRVSGLPEFEGELPASAMAEEMEVEGPGQVRALITYAANPSLSNPNSARVRRALAGLEFMASIDPYLNETTRHADVILPPTLGLEHDQYPIIFAALAVRNYAKYAPALLRPPAGTRPDWWIQLELARRLVARRDGRIAGAKLHAMSALVTAAHPRRALALLLRLSQREWPREARVGLQRLLAHPEGIDLGPLEPRLPAGVRHPDGRIRVAPEVLVEDVARAARALDDAPPVATMRLIGRRELRSNNSWLHNSHRLTKGPERCVLLMHSRDAAARGVATGDEVEITRANARLEVPVEVTDDIMPGVVSLPHGWGHDDAEARLRVAHERPGRNANLVTDERFVDPVSGTTSLFGIPVEVRARQATEAAETSTD